MIKNNSGLRKILAPICFFVVVFLPGFSRAESTVDFHGTLIANSCTPGAVDVDFGEVKLSDASATTPGDTAKETFSLVIDCTNGFTGEVQYRFKGTGTSFNQQAFETDVPGLGIIITDMQGTPSNIKPDIWYTFSSGNGSHEMAASLVRDPGATISGGDFNATTTIEVQIP